MIDADGSEGAVLRQRLPSRQADYIEVLREIAGLVSNSLSPIARRKSSRRSACGLRVAMRSQLKSAGVLLLLVLCGSAKGHAEESCPDIERNYDVIKAEAVSVQTNSALFAAADSGCEDLARQLIAAGASVLARDRLGAAPLAHAAREGRLKLVALFLAAAAPINARAVDGGTALFAAAEHEKPSTVRLLLAKGADPNLTGRSGLTPLIAAAFAGNDRIVEELMAHGADPNVRDTTGKTAMTYAAARGFDDIVRRLLGAGVDARARYGGDLTALMWAAGHDEGVGATASGRVIDLLLAHGAAVDDADDRGRTALMIAAELGYADVVAVLLRRGADRARKDKNGKSALDLATNAGVRDTLSAQ
jgi:ankyrin repeat protein